MIAWLAACAGQKECDEGFGRADDGNCYPVQEAPPPATSADVDSDGDGVSDGDEASQGLDPLDPDSDDDGLTDGEEVDQYHTDPLSADTDADTYTDRDEITEGTDPNDDASRIYQGYWPYNPDKDAMNDPGFGNGITGVGERVPRFQWADQFRDSVDFYDFAQHDRRVIFVVCKDYISYCVDLTLYFASLSSDALGLTFPKTRKALDAGDLYMVIALDDGSAVEFGRSYVEEAPICIVEDAQQQLIDQIGAFDAYPAAVVLDDELRVEIIGDAWPDVLDQLESEL
jgi:hypothetical protein